MIYHVPVLPEQSAEGLVWRPDGIYVDATLGGGGHSRLILQRLNDKGHLFVFDQDEDALRNMPEDPRMTCIQSNFRHLGRFMEYYKVETISGLMADLGVSSWQFDKLERGFSFRPGAPLDMRMNQAQKTTAADWLARVSEEELLATLSQYGQVRNAKTVARAIVRARESGSIMTSDSLLSNLEPLIRGNRQRYLAQVFQAIRIAVNNEMGALKELLETTGELLEHDGRLVVLSYHSVEDRIVKQFMKTGNTEGEVVKDAFGNIRKTFRLITPKPVVADQEEVKRNPRARSVRLRIAEKL